MSVVDSSKEDILRYIAEMESDISGVDARIAEANLLLASLHQQRHSMTERANAYKHRLTPIHKLPVEVLGYVFRLYQASRNRDYSRAYDEIKPGPSPWLLRSICKHWSAVADDIPELWTKIELKYPSSFLEHAITTQMRQIHPHLPAQVTIVENDPAKSPLVAALEQFSGGIDSITLRGIDPAQWATLLPHGCGVSSWLSQLVKFSAFSGYGNGGRYEGKTLSKITDFFCPWSPCHLPWSQLTCIDVDLGMTIGAASDLLPECSSLVECSIAITGPDSDPRSRSYNGPSTLRSLRKLQLTIRSALCYSVLFEALTLPALKVLELLLPHELDSSPNEHDIDSSFLDLKHRSSLDLKEFSVEVGHLSHGALIDFLQDMPSLCKIDILATPSVVNRQFMSALTVRSGKPQRLAPCLEQFVLKFWDHYDEDVSLEWIVDMLESRIPPLGGPRDASGFSLAPGYLQTVRLSLINGHTHHALWKENVDLQSRLEDLGGRGIRMHSS